MKRSTETAYVIAESTRVEFSLSQNDVLPQLLLMNNRLMEIGDVINHSKQTGNFAKYYTAVTV